MKITSRNYSFYCVFIKNDRWCNTDNDLTIVIEERELLIAKFHQEVAQYSSITLETSGNVAVGLNFQSYVIFFVFLGILRCRWIFYVYCHFFFWKCVLCDLAWNYSWKDLVNKCCFTSCYDDSNKNKGYVSHIYLISWR